MDQAEQDIGDLNALRAKRDAAQAALGKAELDLSLLLRRADVRCAGRQSAHRLGQFVAPGPAPVFALVDTRAWYVMANYRETELAHIAPGMEAEVYLHDRPAPPVPRHGAGHRLGGEPGGRAIAPGVPQIERELNWVHIAQRFPVRIRIENPQPAHVFRVGASAVTIVLGSRTERRAAG